MLSGRDLVPMPSAFTAPASTVAPTVPTAPALAALPPPMLHPVLASTLEVQAGPPPVAKRQRLGTEESNEWCDVFTLMHQSNMEARAAEYAGALVTLKNSAYRLRRQRSCVQSACKHLLDTAYRESAQVPLADPAGACASALKLQSPAMQSRPDPGNIVEEMPGNGNLWVGGLPEGISEGMFQTLFARYGNIASIQLMSEQRCGLVRYSAVHEAQTAITALNGFQCNGVKLVVRPETR